MKNKFKTFDQMSLDKLSELNNPTRTEWANAMGYHQTNAMHKHIKNLVERGQVLQSLTHPYRYKLPEAI